MPFLQYLAKLTSPSVRRAAPAGCACPSLPLTLFDGIPRTYLLDDPVACPGPHARHAAYHPRVHLAYLLAQQGRDSCWLAQFTDLPPAAAHRISRAATGSPANHPASPGPVLHPARR
ncbi:hypothetical protein ACFYZ9_19085 [Streptomyces sp. NPDC001691]|uniref:hypothetical protein n=1 Tax=unclassified Streptomyces TaxID=2593676 RepID=UPI000DEBD413|nr:hypothetical protein [Streptomyces sp. SDr-06]RCH67607.1 hypothetical protein DT019_15140 [Streptomyces sp. SDr-06]